jgi:hypothetical protein
MKKSKPYDASVKLAKATPKLEKAQRQERKVQAAQIGACLLSR